MFDLEKMCSDPNGLSSGGQMEFAASDDPPSRIDLVELYASLSENAEDVSKHFLPENSYKNGGDFIYIQAFENGKFVGVLRAWFDKASKRGIVYEVAVRREYQEKHAGHFLVKQLQTKFGRNCGMASQDWIGYPYRAAQKLDRDLNIIRTIYGMSLSLAFGNILNAFGKRRHGLGWEIDVLYILLAFAVATVGYRFYFTAGNVRRFFLERVLQLKVPSVKQLLLVHLPILFIHAIFFFVLCDLFGKLVEKGPSGELAWVAGLFSLMLFVNSFWLIWIILHTRSRNSGEDSWVAEGKWYVNNLCWGFVSAVFAVILSCGGFQDEKLAILLITVIVAGNSAVDFSLTSRAYLLGDALRG
jgi:hypothetical protein